MTKRFEPMKEFGRTTKKPKLDININKGRASINAAISTYAQNNAATGRMGVTFSGLKPTTRSPAKCSPVSKNLWDDDDDDVILLATQVAETKAATAYNKPMRIVNIADSELTFSDFAPNVHTSTSTQRPPQAVNTTAAHFPIQDSLSQMFGDDDDDDFALLAVAVDNDDKSQPKPTTVVDEVFVLETEELTAFKKPKQQRIERTNYFKSQAHTAATNYSGNDVDGVEMPTSQSTARRQLATERQINFLMQHLDILKKENAKMSKDLGEAKSKMESKNGEASLLRDELRHTKQQMQTLKMEKICSTEAAKEQCKTQIAELSKQVEAKETALQLKSVEYSVLKMRHADETKRFELSMRDASMCPGVPDARVGEPHNTLKIKAHQQITRKLKRLRALNVTTQVEIAAEPACSNSSAFTRLVNELFYEHSHERGTTKLQRTVFQVELEHMQTIIAQLQLKREQQHRLSGQDTHSYTEHILTSVSKVFPEFWSYVHSLEFPKSCRIHPYHDYDLRSDMSDLTRQSLLQPTELFEEERALTLRRYVAALGITCRLLPALTLALLTYRHGEYVLMQIGIDAICKLSYAREICEHFGLLEAFAVLLHCMLVNMSSNSVISSDRHAELLVGFLKQLIFARPSAWILREVSYSMLQCTQLPAVLSLLCVNSGASSFVSDRVKSLYRFSNDSCVLQVYAGLLEIMFPLYTPLRAKHFELLAVICANHVRFVYYCLANPPKFVHRLLPCYDEVEDEDEAEAEEEQVENAVTVAKLPPNSNNSNSTNSTHVTVELQISGNSTTVVNGSSSTEALVAPQQRDHITCECYTKLCLSVITLLFQLLRQWLRAHKLWETSRVSEISKISVQLLHIIFCDNYLTRLFRDTEETTKHYLCLICKWWAENAEVLHFNQIHLNFLQKLQNSHVIPKPVCEEETLENISADLAEWFHLTSDDVQESCTAATDALHRLQLIETAGHVDTFLEGLKGYAFNFQ